jgi:hypothetical protein
VRAGNAREKVKRDCEIVADRARGLTWRTIAARHGLSERQCRTVWAERRPPLAEALEGDLVAALEEALAGLDAVIEDCALLAERTANDAVRLGAIKARMAAMGERFSLLRACGLLPHDLGLWRQEIDLASLMRTMDEVFERHDVSTEALADLGEALRAHSVRKENGAVTA